jgi:hypothetical protein
VWCPHPLHPQVPHRLPPEAARGATPTGPTPPQRHPRRGRPSAGGDSTTTWQQWQPGTAQVPPPAQGGEVQAGTVGLHPRSQQLEQRLQRAVSAAAAPRWVHLTAGRWCCSVAVGIGVGPTPCLCGCWCLTIILAAVTHLHAFLLLLS